MVEGIISVPGPDPQRKPCGSGLTGSRVSGRHSGAQLLCPPHDDDEHHDEHHGDDG